MNKPARVGSKAEKTKYWQPTASAETEEIPESKDEGVSTVDDKLLLEKQESIIASNVGAFLLLGEALSIIKGRNLQKQLHPELSFDEYCSKKWGFGKAYAYRLISGYECVQHLKVEMSPHGVTQFPRNEAQVRPLTGLKPTEQVKAWAAALKKADGGSLTGELIEEVVAGLTGKTNKSYRASETKGAGAKAEHKKLKIIAGLVGKALKVDPEERSIETLSKVLMKIQKLLS